MTQRSGRPGAQGPLAVLRFSEKVAKARHVIMQGALRLCSVQFSPCSLHQLKSYGYRGELVDWETDDLE